MMSKSDFDSFRISSIKTMAVEIYKILNDMSPGYLSFLFSKSNVPHPYQLIFPKPLTPTICVEYVELLGFANQASLPPLQAP